MYKLITFIFGLAIISLPGTAHASQLETEFDIQAQYIEQHLAE